MSKAVMTREDWLQALLTRATAGWPVGNDLPENVRISCGFPAQRKGRVARPVEHYRPADSDGGLWEIFVSPTMADAAEVARQVSREAARIALGRAPSEAEIVRLDVRADSVVKSLPPYPHSAVKLPGLAVRPEGTPGPGSRLLKVHCERCGYTARITRRWIRAGVPLCPADNAHGIMRAEIPGE